MNRTNFPRALSIIGKSEADYVRELQTTINEMQRRQVERVYVRVVKSGSQSIPNATVTVLTWQTQVVDPLEGQKSGVGMWTPASNTRLTIDRAGMYVVQAVVTYAYNAIGPRQSRINKNGAELQIFSMPVSGSGLWTEVNGIVIAELAIGDYLEALAYQDSGAALDVIDHAVHTHFSAALLK